MTREDALILAQTRRRFCVFCCVTGCVRCMLSAIC